MGKMGRPLTDNPKYHKVTVRMTEGEYQDLKEYAKAHNLTMSEAVKLGIDLLYQQTVEKSDSR